MNRSLFGLLLNGIVIASAGVGMTAAEAKMAGKYPKAVQSPGNPASQQLIGEQQVGSQLKQESLQALPFVLNAVLKDASERTGKPTSELNIVQKKQNTWSDSCLGLSGGGVSCKEGEVPGWEVTVASGANRWVYRTNLSGTLVKLDSSASRGALARMSKPSSTQTATPIRPSGETEPSTQRTTPPSVRVSGQSTTRKLPLRPIVLPEQVGLRNSPPPVISGQNTGQQQVSVRPSDPTMSNTRSQKQPASGSSSIAAPVSFTDVPANHWAKDFIAELAQKQIIKGSADRFRPEDPVTRGEFAAMLSLAFNKPNIREAVDFKDVSPNEWFHSYLEDVYQRGFFDLEPGKIVNPTKNVTRLDVIVALAKGLNYSLSGSPAKVLQVYSDASAIPSDLRRLVAAATERGSIVNYPDVQLINPDKLATRAEVAALIYQGMVSTGDAVGITSPYVVGEQKNTGSVRNVREVDRRPRRSSQ